MTRRAILDKCIAKQHINQNARSLDPPHPIILFPRLPMSLNEGPNGTTPEKEGDSK